MLSRASSLPVIHLRILHETFLILLSVAKPLWHQMSSPAAVFLLCLGKSCQPGLSLGPWPLLKFSDHNRSNKPAGMSAWRESGAGRAELNDEKLPENRDMWKACPVWTRAGEKKKNSRNLISAGQTLLIISLSRTHLRSLFPLWQKSVLFLCSGFTTCQDLKSLD